MATPSQIILRSREDWDDWFTVIQIEARSRRIWEFIDPNSSEILLLEEPSYQHLRHLQGIQLKLAKLRYKQSVGEYQRKKDAIDRMIPFMLGRIATHYLPFVKDMNTPREWLETLQYHASMSVGELRRKYGGHLMGLCEGPNDRSVSLESWIQDWETTMARLWNLGKDGFLENEMLVKAFLDAIRDVDREFVEDHLEKIGRLEVDNKPIVKIEDLVKLFRAHQHD